MEGRDKDGLLRVLLSCILILLVDEDGGRSHVIHESLILRDAAEEEADVSSSSTLVVTVVGFMVPFTLLGIIGLLLALRLRARLLATGVFLPAL